MTFNKLIFDTIWQKEEELKMLVVTITRMIERKKIAKENKKKVETTTSQEKYEIQEVVPRKIRRRKTLK